MIRYLLGKLAASLSPIYAFFTVSGGAIPNIIEIGDGETVTIDIGLINTDTGEFDTDPDFSCPFYMNARFLNYEVEQYPGNISEGSWYVTFHPKSVQLLRDDARPKKTQMTISFTAPNDPAEAIQSGVLQIKIQDMQAMGNLWWPKGKITGNLARYSKLGWKINWALGAILAGFGKYSGTIDTESFSTVDILVKVKPYHKIRFEALPLQQIKPGDITSIPIKIQNLGNYKDTFGFRIISTTSNNTISNPISISLEPGEEKNTYLSVAVPPNILDTGTVHSIRIQAYSIDQPNVTIQEQSVFIETKGLYISEIYGIGILIFLLIILIIALVLLYRRKKLISKMNKKPEKPWNNPEKQKELKQLKNEDRNKYKKTINQIKSEYISSLAVYKAYKKSYIKEQKKKSRKRITALFHKSEKQNKTTRPEKKQKLKKIQNNQNNLSKSHISFPFTKKQTEPIKDETAERDKQKKDQIIKTIQKEQDKQRKNNW
ncbi:MAG: hypothetical protein JXA00_06710 [Candidatus Thermoplasmatota archaeon]|nr:hypothetical protein [Candidatus Thermoplasmatota archaeon]